MYPTVSRWFISLTFTTLAALSLSSCVNVKAKTIEQDLQPAKEAIANHSDISKEPAVNDIDMVTLMNDCNETFRTEMSNIESLNNTGSFPVDASKTAKCFVRCLLESSGAISTGGEVDPERAAVFFAAQRGSKTEDDLRDSTDACSHRNETCMCERSYEFVRCVMTMELNKYDALKDIY